MNLMRNLQDSFLTRKVACVAKPGSNSPLQQKKITDKNQINHQFIIFIKHFLQRNFKSKMKI